jgi:hypothetical protein
MNRERDLQKLMSIPDKLLVKEVNFWKDECVVSAKFGDDIGQTTAIAFAWFMLQKEFTKITVENLNGTDVIMVKRS